MALSREAAEREFAALYGRTHLKILSYCLRRTRIRADALDAAADTYVVAWRRFDDVPRGPDALPWLFGVARRVLANQHRAERRRLDMLSRLPAYAADTGLGPDEPTIVDEEHQGVLRAMDRLSPDDGELLRLHAWEGLSHRELAATFECSEGAVKVRLHRARRRLAKEYERDMRRPSRPFLRAAGGPIDG